MASIRRTLSPVPRGRNAANVEASSVGSPLSRSSLSPHSSASSQDSRAFMLGLFSPRSLRALEKSNPKGQLWRKVLFHFFICFLVGVSIGFIPFASRNLSTSLMPKQQTFTYEMISAGGNLHPFKDAKINVTPSNNEAPDLNATLSSSAKGQELTNEVADKIFDSQVLSGKPDLESLKLLIIVTPTIAHPFQAYYLHRLAQTLKLVPPPLLWIVVEMTSQSEETAEILRSSGVMYRHLICKSNITNMSHQIILQRNVALTHIETHRLDGILYFADDDNIYTVELYQHMREIRRFGTWLVAKLSGDKSSIVLQGPICNGSRVIGWYIDESNWRSRRFHAEMSGFAFNSTIIWDPKRWHRPTLEPIRQLDIVKEDFWVSTLIEQIVEDESQMEGLMNNCSSVMVWHIGLESSLSFYPLRWIMKTNLDVILPLSGDS